MSCHVPFVWGVFGDNDEAVPSPGFAGASRIGEVACRLFPGAPLSGFFLVAGWLSNMLRVSELARYEFDVSVFDALAALLEDWSPLAPSASPPPLRRPADALIAGGHLVARAPSFLDEWTHVPLLPSFFDEPVVFARYASPLEAARGAEACGGYVGSNTFTAALPTAQLYQSLATQLFTYRLNTNVLCASPLTPVIVWFLQHGGEDTTALADYVAAWFRRWQLWERSNRGNTRTEWRWFCTLVRLAQEKYDDVNEVDVWRMLGLFLLQPPPYHKEALQKPLFYLDRCAAMAKVRREEKIKKPSSQRRTPIPRENEARLWGDIMNQHGADLAVVLLAGLYRKPRETKRVPDRVFRAYHWLPVDCGLMEGTLCRCKGRKCILPSPAQLELCNDDEELATFLARGRLCDGSCKTRGPPRQNMPCLFHARRKGSPFNSSSTARPLERVDVYLASVAPRLVCDTDADMVIVPEVMWRALLQNEYRVHGLDPQLADDFAPPLATWKGQGTGVCFRNDTVPAFPLWEAHESKHVVKLDQLSPATASAEPATRYPPVKIEPLQSRRMCICKIFDNGEFDSRRSARVMAPNATQVRRSASENELRAADEFRLSHNGALPKVGDVTW